MITCAQVDVREAELAGRERDSLVLTAEERRWGRRRVTTRAGGELALALPTGSVLVPGAILHVGPDWYVVVEGAAEPVLAVTPASREEALRVAFEVGNRHFTLALDGERLLVPDDPAMDQLLTRLGIRFERDARGVRADRSGPPACRRDPALLTLLQFADGLFPAGGFAHSFGLETYVQDGRVRDRRVSRRSSRRISRDPPARPTRRPPRSRRACRPAPTTRNGSRSTRGSTR